MKRTLPDGLELDDDHRRIDVDAVYRFLAGASYWAPNRSRELVAGLVQSAQRVVGAYDGSKQIGFCRVVTDGVSFAWLADVFVLPSYRGRGVGTEMVREAVERGPHAKLLWLLGTRDAHRFYERAGFRPASSTIMERPRGTA